jgi:hypothetical protein
MKEALCVAAQECDATTVTQRFTAGYKKIILIHVKTSNLKTKYMLKDIGLFVKDFPHN